MDLWGVLSVRPLLSSTCIVLTLMMLVGNWKTPDRSSPPCSAPPRRPSLPVSSHPTSTTASRSTPRGSPPSPTPGPKTLSSKCATSPKHSRSNSRLGEAAVISNYNNAVPNSEDSSRRSEWDWTLLVRSHLRMDSDRARTTPTTIRTDSTKDQLRGYLPPVSSSSPRSSSHMSSIRSIPRLNRWSHYPKDSISTSSSSLAPRNLEGRSWKSMRSDRWMTLGGPSGGSLREGVRK